VRSPQGIYWWNVDTDETTAVGAPRPTGNTAIGAPRGAFVPMDAAGGGVVSQVASAFVLGAGVSVGFAAVGVAFRIFGG
jgi:hypothetical protein